MFHDRSCCVAGLAPDHRDLGHDKEANCELGITRAFDNFEIPRLIDAADMASNAARIRRRFRLLTYWAHPPGPTPWGIRFYVGVGLYSSLRLGDR